MRKKTLLLCILVVVFLLVAAVLLVPGMLRSNNYKTATQLAEHGMFSEAAIKFAELHNYKDSDQYVDYCLMQIAVNDHDWNRVLELSNRIPDFMDTPQWRSYAKASQSFDSGLLEETIGELNHTQMVAPAEQLLSTAQAEYAEQKINVITQQIANQQWDQAFMTADSALQYCDDVTLRSEREYCIEMIHQRDYSAAKAAVLQGDFGTAQKLIEKLGDYADSQVIAGHLAVGEAGCAYAQAMLTESNDPFVMMEAYQKAIGYSDATEKFEQYQAEANAQTYANALNLYVDQKWSAAMKIFQELGSYQDSNVYACVCNEYLNQANYDQAARLFENGDYQAAKEEYEKLGAYRDAAVQTVKCEYAIKESMYQSAVNSISWEDYQSAADTLAKLGEYKDAAVLLKYANEMMVRGNQQ